jgi:hypothetical protein
MKGVDYVCWISKTCKANNRYLHDFNENEPENYLLYLDANNLYGWAMCEYLPCRDIEI